eukprot:SAG22_NODE_3822_length_1515_cov_1.134887_2_plen_146_part_00
MSRLPQQIRQSRVRVDFSAAASSWHQVPATCTFCVGRHTLGAGPAAAADAVAWDLAATWERLTAETLTVYPRPEQRRTTQDPAYWLTLGTGDVLNVGRLAVGPSAHAFLAAANHHVRLYYVCVYRRRTTPSGLDDGDDEGEGVIS